MEPFEALTDYDLQTIKDYIHVYGGTHCGPLEKVLQEWNKNKRTLFNQVLFLFNQFLHYCGL